MDDENKKSEKRILMIRYKITYKQSYWVINVIY